MWHERAPVGGDAEQRGLGRADLDAKVRELKEEQFNLRFQLATGQLDNHRRIRTVKREVALIRTVLRERELVEEEQS